MLLAVTPLPNPERTPPLTTTYFIDINGLLGCRASLINIPVNIPKLEFAK
jgi:hypothetical protein